MVHGRAIRRSAATKLLYSDASDFAWGAVLFDGELGSVDPAEPGLQIPGVRVHGALTLAEQADGIVANELRLVLEPGRNDDHRNTSLTYNKTLRL